jgi:hypothetical protein
LSERISAWWTRRSIIAVAVTSSPKISPQPLNGLLDVTISEARSYRLDAIDRDLCLAFKAHKLRESAEIRAALAAGADLRDKQGRPMRPLGPASLRKVIDALAAILDDAIEDELIDRNPARGKRMRVRVPKPARTFPELDELVALIEAAEEQDRVPSIAQPIHATETQSRVARLAASGIPPSAIAAGLGIAKATVSFHLANLGAGEPAGVLGTQGDRRDARAQRTARERAVRPALP